MHATPTAKTAIATITILPPGKEKRSIGTWAIYPGPSAERIRLAEAKTLGVANVQVRLRRGVPTDLADVSRRIEACCLIEARARGSRPRGTFDQASRWYPDDDERAKCCSSIYPPSRAYPYTLLKHCFSGKHTAAKFGFALTELTEVRRAVKAILATERGAQHATGLADPA